MGKGRSVKQIRTVSLIAALAMVFSSVSVLFGCSRDGEQGLIYLGSFLSSDVYICIYDDASSSTEFIAACKKTVDEYEKTLSVKESGDVAAFNDLRFGEKVKVSSLTAELIEYAKTLNEETGGAIDPTVYMLVDLWGFSYRFDEFYMPEKPFDRARIGDALPLPEEKYVSAFLSITDIKAVGVKRDQDGIYLFKNCPSVAVDGTEYEQKIDLSSIAKGALSDALKDIAASYGVKNYYLSLGMSSLYLGEKDGGAWETLLVDPKDDSRAEIGSVLLKNKSISTSGVYEKNYRLEDVTVHHIIDPSTGRCAETDLLSAAVIGENGVLADALSTALIVMGSERAKEFIKNYPELDFVLVKDGEILSTIDMSFVKEGYSLTRL